MWTDGWIGIPYQELGRGPEGYDCLGLFVALQLARHGREICDPLCTVAVAARQKVAMEARRDWQKVTHADEGDALLFKVRGLELHVGYALDQRLMLHTSQETQESILEDYTTRKWGDRLEGVYRYEA